MRADDGDIFASGNVRCPSRLCIDVSGSNEVAEPSRDEAVALLWLRHYGVLVRVAAGLTGDVGTAEEVVQDAFAALLRRWASVRDPSATYTYLLRTVVNGARGRWRRQRREHDSAATMRSLDVQVGVDSDSRVDVLAALGRLPYGKRACLLLRYYADLSQAEVASTLGVTVGTVKSQTAKGLKELAEFLDVDQITAR
jgi:RNA polymerase sigma-70 factor (sigma-E family)